MFTIKYKMLTAKEIGLVIMENPLLGHKKNDLFIKKIVFLHVHLTSSWLHFKASITE